MRETKNATYESPIIDVITITVERGFAMSESNSVEGWGNGGSHDEFIPF